MARNPQFKKASNKPMTNGPKSVEEYLAQLESLLKRNTGQGMYVGQDVSSNTPMYIPGKVFNPSGLGESAPSVSAYGNGMLQPAPVERPAPIELPQEEEPITIEDFLSQFEQSFSAPENQPQMGLTQIQGIASTADGGVLTADGSIFYNDGTFRTGDPGAVGMQSLQDGTIRYSDGSIRRPAPQGIQSLAGDRERILYDDGVARYGQYNYNQSPAGTPGGTEGLISGIFGQIRPITQAYGNYNPELEPGSGYNLGTDVRTRDLQGGQREFKLPIDVQVVEVLQDDGTRWGDVSGHQGYGNSVLVRLPTGEMLRFSHLSQIANLQPGQTIRAGQVFGLPGATGNTTGEHLDLEYYDQSGQRANPQQFSGFSDPNGLRTPDPSQPAPGTRVEEPRMSSQPAPSEIIPKVNEVAKTTQNVLNKTLPQGKLDVGASEGVFTPEATQARQESVLTGKAGTQNPFRQLAGNTLEAVGDRLGIPEGSFSELVAGGKTRRTNLANASDGNFQALPDKFNEDQYSPNLTGDIQRAADFTLGKAGDGLTALKNAGAASLENIFKPQQTQEKRAVGDVSGTVDAEGQPQFSSLMDTASAQAGKVKNDIRDNFFKLGGSDIYKNFLKPDAESLYGGALKLDLFTDDFFKDYGNITSVFGGSKDLSGALDKFIGFEKQKYQPASRMSYEDGYDRGEVDNYNREVDAYNNSLNSYFNQIRTSAASVPSIFTSRIPGSVKNVFSGSTRPAVSAVAAPANISLAKPSISQVSAPRMTPTNANMSTNQGPVRAPAPSAVPTPAPKTAPKPNMTPANANLSTNRGPVVAQKSSPKPQSKPVSNVFSKVTSAIRNIFRR